MKLRKRQIRDYLFLFLGVLLIGISSKNIYSPMNLIIGGVSGVSIILNHLIGMPLWLSNTVINIPLFLVGGRVKGWRFIRRTFFATMLLSLLLWLIPDVPIIPKQDLFLSSIFGGIIMGIGSGLIFLAEATSGGTDLLAAIIQKYLRHYTLPQVMQFLDAVIVLWGLQIFGVEHALYAIVSIYVFTRVSDGILEGMHFAKAAYIISAKSKEIAKRIQKDMERGVTGIPSHGLYSGASFEMLYCVLSRREITKLKDLVHEIDERAFLIIADVREVLGEGFNTYKE